MVVEDEPPCLSRRDRSDISSLAQPMISRTEMLPSLLPSAAPRMVNNNCVFNDRVDSEPLPQFSNAAKVA